MGLTVSVTKEDDGLRTLHQFGEFLCAQQGGGQGLTVRAQDNERLRQTGTSLVVSSTASRSKLTSSSRRSSCCGSRPLKP